MNVQVLRMAGKSCRSWIFYCLAKFIESEWLSREDITLNVDTPTSNQTAIEAWCANVENNINTKSEQAVQRLLKQKTTFTPIMTEI